MWPLLQRSYAAAQPRCCAAELQSTGVVLRTKQDEGRGFHHLAFGVTHGRHRGPKALAPLALPVPLTAAGFAHGGGGGRHLHKWRAGVLWPWTLFMLTS
jgi:hypothetical protein